MIMLGVNTSVPIHQDHTLVVVMMAFWWMLPNTIVVVCNCISIVLALFMFKNLMTITAIMIANKIWDLKFAIDHFLNFSLHLAKL